MSNKTFSTFSSLKKDFHPVNGAVRISAQPAPPPGPSSKAAPSSGADPRSIFAQMMGDRPPTPGTPAAAVAAATAAADEALETEHAALDKLAAKLATADLAREDLAAKLATAEQEKTDLAAKLATAEQEKTDLAAKLATTEQEKADLAAKLATAETARAALAKENATLRSALEQAKAQAQDAADDPETRLLKDELDRLSERNKSLRQKLSGPNGHPSQAESGRQRPET